MKFEEKFWTAAIVLVVAAGAWWGCWPSASSDEMYYRERWEERGGLAASMIGFEDRLYAIYTNAPLRMST